MRLERSGVLLEVAYGGTRFHGWAPQPGVRTVAGELMGAIRAVDPHASELRGTSRTDAGVHARGQLAAFDAAVSLPARGWVLLLNQHLADDLSVRRARSVPLEFAPRFAATKKRYVYRLLRDRVRDPLWHERTWRIGWELDEAKAADERRRAVGKHDFRAFRSQNDQRVTTVRTVLDARLDTSESEPRLWQLSFEGTAFLYNMVRILSGTVIDVARGHLAPGAVTRALASGQRSDAGMTAPAAGLTLEHIDIDLPAGTGEPWPP